MIIRTECKHCGEKAIYKLRDKVSLSCERCGGQLEIISEEKDSVEKIIHNDLRGGRNYVDWYTYPGTTSYDSGTYSVYATSGTTYG